MPNNNDKRILDLKKQIELKKELLKKTERFNPITNCSIELDNERYNINVLQRNQLVDLMVKLNMYKLSAEDLELEEYIINGYKVYDWIIDIKAKLNILSRREEEIKLKVMEEKLTRLLSEEKQTELEIDEIENIIKNN